MSAAGALMLAIVLSGCGTTTYFAGRTLPPSGLANRVLIAIQNPSPSVSGSMQFVDAYYDIRFKYNSNTVNPSFSISSYSGKLPITIQNMPEEQRGAVYGAGDGSFDLIDYSQETTSSSSTVNGLTGLSSSIFISRTQVFAVAANQSYTRLTVVNRSTGGVYTFSLPGVYRVSMNPGGSVALAFVQNSNYAYYPLQLTSAQTIAYSGGPGTWPTGAVDCEPLNAPTWCLFQVLGSDGNPLSFNRPVKALFSADGATAYILNCGPECGGANGSNPTANPLSNASITILPVAPMIFLLGQQSGLLPTQSAISTNCATSGTLSGCSIPVPGGASNGLVDASTLYVVGQQPQQIQGQTFFGGNLSVVNLASSTASAPIPISDGAPGVRSRMILADDNTLWIGMTQCINGVRFASGRPDGCLTMVNTNTNAATLMPYNGDATGIAAVTGLHKIYTAEGGQVYIHSTVDGSMIDNQYVTVTGTAYDVAYMDGLTDDNNTVY
jgi:hypothetical protein